MSLDVYLTFPGGVAKEPRDAIFVRLDGAVKEITADEWEALHPGVTPTTVRVDDTEQDDEVYSANITHNLGGMAVSAGLYKPLWRPEDIGAKTARDLLVPLSEGLALLRSDRARFEVFAPVNGWGTYDGLVAFTESYLEACAKWPEAGVHTSR